MNLIKKIKFIFKSVLSYKNFILALQCYFKPKEKEIIRLRNGLQFFIRTKTDNDFEILNDISISKLYMPNRNFIPKKGDIIVDIGAHIGVYSILCARIHSSIRLFSYEPSEENYYLFNKNIKLNKISNISPFKEGIAGKKGSRTLIIDKEHSGRHSMITGEGKKEKINCITLKDVFEKNKIKKCDILKMDIEGAEYEVLFNTPHTYFNKINNIVIEYHPHHKFNYNDLIRFFKERNFKFSISKKNSILYFFK